MASTEGTAQGRSTFRRCRLNKSYFCLPKIRVNHTQHQRNHKQELFENGISKKGKGILSSEVTKTEPNEAMPRLLRAGDETPRTGSRTATGPPIIGRGSDAPEAKRKKLQSSEGRHANPVQPG